MTTIVPQSAAEAVANGAQLLDEKQPGWWRKIDLGWLDIQNCNRCVCGQLAAGDRFDDFAYRVLGVPERELGVYGFVNYHYGRFTTYGELTAEWRLAIQARLDADQLHEKITAKRKEPAIA